MQKDPLTIQIIGSNQARLVQHRAMISALLNKEVTSLLLDSSVHGSLYKDKKPPRLLILLLDDLTIEVLDQLIALPLSVRPALLVIASDPNNRLMRLSMQAGARDFFSEPVDKEELHKALNRIIFDLQRGQSRQGILTTVINAKGGSGGSFIACNLAHIASIVSDSSVVLLDFDLQFGSQSLNLDLKPQHTIIEALNDVDNLDFDAIDGYMAQHSSGLRLLSTVHEQIVLPHEISADSLNKLLTLAISNYDRVFVDLPRQIDPLSITMLERSDQIVVVIQQSLAHMRDAKRLTRILKSELGISEKNIIVVVNRFDSNSSLQVKDIQSTLECSEVFTIPNDFEKVAQSINLGIPLYNYARKTPITKALLAFTEALKVNIDEEHKEKGFFHRLFDRKHS
jgi:pilus assembly protein CpaE